jgi:dihydroflavonol-4-reductase
MKTVVTGASGFIGSAVVRKLLAEGREVRCLIEPGASRQNLAGLDVEIVVGDVNDRSAVAAAVAGCDVLYHLAAIYKLWMSDYAPMYRVNVEGTQTVLWAAYKAGVRRVVYTSSIAAIGQRDDGVPADESVAFNLWSEAGHYIRSKVLSEREALRFAAEGLPVVVVNPAFPFGARDIGPTPTGRFVKQLLAGQVPAWPPGGFNAVDVEDVAAGHLAAERKGRVGERYILGGHNITYAAFFAQAAKIAGVRPPRRGMPPSLLAGVGRIGDVVAARLTHKEPPITYKEARWAARRYFFDNRKAVAELGLAVTPLADSIARSVRWFRAQTV